MCTHVRTRVSWSLSFVSGEGVCTASRGLRVPFLFTRGLRSHVLSRDLPKATVGPPPGSLPGHRPAPAHLLLSTVDDHQLGPHALTRGDGLFPDILGLGEEVAASLEKLPVPGALAAQARWGGEWGRVRWAPGTGVRSWEPRAPVFSCQLRPREIRTRDPSLRKPRAIDSPTWDSPHPRPWCDPHPGWHSSTSTAGGSPPGLIVSAPEKHPLEEDDFSY